ncbi:hypothetical protein [Paraburkholderia sp. GAS82]|jgi:hypothetical protein|uniref:hypothetical protein n=1 Tax=Paraburkholderia sp. GAS82 TaxID=3035137 RepID=UPI003D24DFC9
MIRLLLLFVYAFAISLLGVAAMKVTIAYMAKLFYGGSHLWGWHDAEDVFVKGFLLGSVFCVFAVVQYLRVRNRL